MELSAFERFLHPEWRQLAELPRHRFVGPTVNGATYCDNCRKSINVTVWPAPCVIDTVGIACHDCGEPVFFPTTALDLELYLMKGTLCSACWTP